MRLVLAISSLWLCATTAAATPDEQEQARALVRSAKEAFDAGDFATAAEKLDKAKGLAPTAATLYNLGRARERAGDLSGAEAAYREYLTLSPNSADRGAVEATIADLQKRLAEAKRLEALEADRKQREAERANTLTGPSVTAAPSPPLVLKVLPFVVAGLGLAGVGAGVGFGLDANARHLAATQARQLEVAQAAQAQANSSARLATGLYVAGGVLLGAAVLWLIIATARSGDAS